MRYQHTQTNLIFASDRACKRWAKLGSAKWFAYDGVQKDVILYAVRITFKGAT
jgi:hypothetical protein